MDPIQNVPENLPARSMDSATATNCQPVNLSDGLGQQVDGLDGLRSQQIYQSLVTTIDGIIWEANAQAFQFTFVSPQAERILGYPVAQWLEPDFWVKNVYAPDLEQAVTTCLTATQELRNHEFEYRMRAADGRLVWIKDIATVIVEDGKPVFLRGIMFDVTPQKQIEASLQDQQMQMGMALDVARMATWEWDMVTDELQYSKNIATVLGIPQTERLTRQIWLQAIHPDDRPQVEATLERSLQEDSPFSVEFRTCRDPHNQRWVTSHGRVFRDEQGKPIRLVGLSIDITQQKNSEERLQQSRNFLQVVLDNLPVAVSVKDGRKEQFGTYTFWNKTCEQLYGLMAEDALGKTAYDCFPIDKANLMHQKDQEIFAHQTAADFLELSLQSVTEERLLHTVKVPIFDEQQQPQYLLCISEDITERKRAEEALRQRVEQETLIAAITNNIRQSLNLREILNTTVAQVREFLQTDRVLILRFRSGWNGTVLVESVASGWSSLLGRVFQDSCFSESLIGLYEQGRVGAIADVQQAELPSCFVELLQEMQVQAMLTVPINQENDLWGLLVAHHCTESRVWQAAEIELLKQLVGQVGIAIQQSELYQQVSRLNADLERQMQIRTAELQLASEFEATLKRITDRVRDNLDEDQILETAVRELAIAIGVTGCNAALYDLESRTSKVSYEYTDSLVPLQGRVVQMDNFPEGYRQLIQGQYFQFCSLVPNPLRGHVAMFACPILDDKGVLGDLWLVSQKYRAFNDQDIRLVQQVANQCAIAIRQARLYQKAQAQVKELEKLNRLKDDFLSTVSHELRTPMSNIKMATQMLEVMLFNAQAASNTTNSASLQKATRYFQILKDECQREINLINDLLDLSRLETGVDVPVLAPIDFNTWIPKLVSPFTERARNQQQQIQLEVPTLPLIVTDLARLDRIMGELLNNACKYTPAHGTITVSAQVMSAAETPGEPTAALFQIAVCNSGVEISPEELTRIFEKFYRVPNNDPWKHGGTGLGLALVKKLLEPLQGNVRATSSNGTTCFVIQLPFQTSDKSGATNASTHPSTQEGV